MSVHFKHLAEMKTLLETKTLTNDGILELDNYKERSELLQCLIHCADLSNPAKAEDLAVNWSNRIMQETFQQGDEERSRGIPLNPLGDREQVSVAKCQVILGTRYGHGIHVVAVWGFTVVTIISRLLMYVLCHILIMGLDRRRPNYACIMGQAPTCDIIMTRALK
jgi:hypothetical protein